MPRQGKLRVVIIKPSKYGVTGYVERFRRGFMPNSTVPYFRSMTPDSIDGLQVETYAIDEYVQTDLEYLDLLRQPDLPTLLALVGVQSHQFQRSLDLAAFARANGVRHCVIGGPHPMTCETNLLHNRGISFALAEAELIWQPILRDAMHGELQPVYGTQQRWQQQLDAPVVQPPSTRDLRRYILPMLGIYPARGCPFTCNFCSVIKIAGRQVRSQSIDITLNSLSAAKSAGVKMVMFTSDNFNKYPEVTQLLGEMIQQKLTIPFFVQCDTQIARQEELLDLLARAGCFQIFVGVESFNRHTLLAAKKAQNHPDQYEKIVRLCRRHGITTHFSNIIGFPDDTVDSILKNVEILCRLSPDLASFYVLTPIPGTEQYDEFLAGGLITETNLDRFDATRLTWRHPTLDAEQLNRLLFDCYRRFSTSRQSLWNAARNSCRKNLHLGLLFALFPIFQRYCAFKETHPMSGGVGHVLIDKVQDYAQHRRQYLKSRFVPLPKSLALSAADSQINARAKLAVSN